jgi:hypothetical protein
MVPEPICFLSPSGLCPFSQVRHTRSDIGRVLPRPVTCYAGSVEWVVRISASELWLLLMGSTCHLQQGRPKGDTVQRNEDSRPRATEFQRQEHAHGLASLAGAEGHSVSTPAASSPPIPVASAFPASVSAASASPEDTATTVASLLALPRVTDISQPGVALDDTSSALGHSSE